MKNNTQNLFNCIYQDTVIHFLLENEGDVMVNATEMAKLFRKRTKDFMANKETKDTILALERTLISVRSDCKNKSERTDMSAHSDIKIVDDRGHMGMYFHRLLAIDFASWLDKDFKVWVLMTIENILFGKIKPLKAVIKKLDNTEKELKDAIFNAQNSESKEAKSLVIAYNSYIAAKKEKNRISRLFTNQIKMDL